MAIVGKVLMNFLEVCHIISMKKPNKKVVKESLDYHEVIKFIEKKYKMDTRDYSGRHNGNPDAAYEDFWHWLIDVHGGDIHNGCYSYIPIDALIDSTSDEYDESDAADTPQFVKEILEMIKTEFHDDMTDGCLDVYIDW